VKYFEQARLLWKTYVPASGQADTVQGELIRAVEKLRDEAQRNGNINWDDGHEILANFIRETLLGSEMFGEEARDEVERDVARLLDFEDPETSDDVFDRLTDRVVEWSNAHPQPVPHAHNPKLLR
jgi:hypothetical protein